jgi:glycerol-3-phosphate acyltransferase PlsY
MAAEALVVGPQKAAEAFSTVAILLTGLIGYLVGSFSSGFVVGKLYRNVDLRKVGSGSTGGTNAFRALGLGAAVLVTVLDIAKGALAVYLAQLLIPEGDERIVAQTTAAIGAIVGHCWPITLRGRGGRGVATGVGALLFIASPAVIFATLFFGAGVLLTRIVSVGSLLAVAGALVGYLVLTRLELMPFHWAALTFIVGGGAVVYVRHIDNIRRLLAGREPRIGETLRT